MPARMVMIGLFMLFLAVAGCRQSATPPVQERYTPGLGEIMTLQQMRHTKLWLAGQGANWALAAYEIKELQEGFDEVVTFHPTHEDAPVAPKDAIPAMIVQPLSQLSSAVQRKDASAFAEAYDTLTAKCNDCHKAMNFGFNVVQRPQMNPYPNQIFALAAP